MPILLDTPFVYDPGHGQPTQTLTHIGIVDWMNVLIPKIERRAIVTVVHGTLVAGELIPGSVAPAALEWADVPAHLLAGGVEVPEDLQFSTVFAAAATQFPTGTLVFAEAKMAIYGLIMLYEHSSAPGVQPYAGTVV